MKNIEWLNINKNFDNFTEDSWKLEWLRFVDKYRIDFNPKSDVDKTTVIIRWLNATHKDIKRCVDKDAIIDYIISNDTSLNNEYFRISVDRFKDFIDSLNYYEIEV